MKEDFLYYLWKFQKFETEELRTSEGELVKVIHLGIQNDLDGPDFFNARLEIGGQLWAGNVEMHLKSSDWYFHQHEIDPNYDNVIIHVVWEHDVEVYRQDNSVIPTLILKDRVDEEILVNYNRLLGRNHLSINCENDFKDFSNFQVEHWLERLYFERLDKKSEIITQLLAETGNDWEEVLFIMLSRSFGLNVNSEAFMQMARSIGVKTLQKLGDDSYDLEALFLGQMALIQTIDQYGIRLQEKYTFLKHKYSLKSEHIPAAKFFRLRPDNFPTIRLAQLAALYAQKKNLFDDLMLAKDLNEINTVLNINISEYWRSHYNFGKAHSTRAKKLTMAFIQLLIINCIVPVRYSYYRYLGKEGGEEILSLLSSIKPEKNAAINVFNQLRPNTASHAMHSQALLQLKNEYCNKNKCLQCELGVALLRKSPKYI